MCRDIENVAVHVRIEVAAHDEGRPRQVLLYAYSPGNGHELNINPLIPEGHGG